MKIDIITVGKLKDSALLAIEKEYSKRIKKFKITIHELRPQQENKDKEGQLILDKISGLSQNSRVVILTEHGKTYTSPNFAKFIDSQLNLGGLILIIGGAAGFSESVINKANSKLSLSPLTFPHQIARVLLMEQLYRAETILNNHPYHK